MDDDGPTEHDDLNAQAWVCTRTVERFADRLTSWDQGGSPDFLVALRTEAREILDHAKRAVEEADRLIIRDLFAGEKGAFPLGDSAEERVTLTFKRTYLAWDHPELVRHVVARVVEQPGVLVDDDGELLPPSVMAHRVAEQLVACVRLSGGKLTGLRAIGLDETEFCRVEYRPTITIEQVG